MPEQHRKLSRSAHGALRPGHLAGRVEPESECASAILSQPSFPCARGWSRRSGESQGRMRHGGSPCGRSGPCRFWKHRRIALAAGNDSSTMLPGFIGQPLTPSPSSLARHRHRRIGAQNSSIAIGINSGSAIRRSRSAGVSPGARARADRAQVVSMPAIRAAAASPAHGCRTTAARFVAGVHQARDQVVRSGCILRCSICPRNIRSSHGRAHQGSVILDPQFRISVDPFDEELAVLSGMPSICAIARTGMCLRSAPPRRCHRR